MFPDRFGIGSNGPVIVLVKAFFCGRKYGSEPTMDSSARYDGILKFLVGEYQKENDLSRTEEIDRETIAHMLDHFKFDLIGLAQVCIGTTAFVYQQEGKYITVRWSPETGTAVSGSKA